MRVLFPGRLTIVLFLLVSISLSGQQLQLAGNPLDYYPYFERVKAFNKNAGIAVAVDPSIYFGIVGQTADIYIVESKKAGEWDNNNYL